MTTIEMAQLERQIAERRKARERHFDDGHEHVSAADIQLTRLPMARINVIVDSLTKALRVPRPVVRWSLWCPRFQALETQMPRGAHTNGYHNNQATIVLGPEVDEATVIHEFAHVVTHERFPLIEWMTGDYAPHGRPFYQSLLATIDVHYGGNRRAYPWWDGDGSPAEYPHIIRWAHRDGYTERGFDIPPEIDQRMRAGIGMEVG